MTEENGSIRVLYEDNQVEYIFESVPKGITCHEFLEMVEDTMELPLREDHIIRMKKDERNLRPNECIIGNHNYVLYSLPNMQIPIYQWGEHLHYFVYILSHIIPFIMFIYGWNIWYQVVSALFFASFVIWFRKRWPLTSIHSENLFDAARLFCVSILPGFSPTEI